MSRLVRPLRAALFALALAGVAGGGCSSGPKLTKIEAPAEGVSLGYDLQPGQTYSGHVRRSETVRDALSGSSMTRSLAFDVDLTVAGPVESGGNKVIARFKNIDLRWSLPAGAPFSLSEFTNSATTALKGLEVDFHVGNDGKVLYRPPMPDSIPMELRIVLTGVLDVLETAFLTVPERPLQIGESWDDEKKRGREGKLGVYMTGTVTTKVAGLFRNEKEEEIAKLEITEKERAVTTTKEGSHENKKEGKTTSLFSTSGSYLVSTKGEITEFDTGNSTTFVKINVDWAKGERLAVAAATPSEDREVQSINDPCDADYVGGEDCVPEGEIQSIADPCDPDYVGPDECTPPAEGDAADDKPADDKATDDKAADDKAAAE